MSNESEFDKAIEEQETDLNRRNRAVRRRNMMILGLAFAASLFALICLFLALENDRLAASNARFAQQQQGEKKEIAKEAGEALCGEGDRQIYDKDLCAKWAEAAGEPTIAPSAPAVPLGPSQADLVQAFRTYCEEGNCRGKDGAPPTPDDIAAAFVTFCADGRCVGKDGADGKPGKDAGPPPYAMVLAAVTEVCSTGVCTGATGKDGAPGKDGANATPEMVLVAVQQFCANDACRGPVGASGADSTVPGPEGKQGPQGRGLDDMQCGDNGRWTAFWSDGSTTDSGVCRNDPGPPLGVLP